MHLKLKNILSVFVTLSLLFFSFPVKAADDGFVIDNGVLVSYSGNATHISIPTDVYRISDSVFYNNKKIESVDLNNVTIIGNNAFRNCSALKTVTEYDSVTYCGAYAFYSTPFQSNRTSNVLIMGSVLVDSTSQGSYTVPSSVKSIAPYAFALNTKITSVTVGDNVSSVGEGAFWKCTNLKNVTMSNKVNYIGGYAFEETVYIDNVSDEFHILGNGILVGVNSSKTDIEIPDTVKQIAAGAFLENSVIKTVTIPKSVSSIGKRAFAKCKSLERADLPETIVSIEAEAFYDCTALKTVCIPASIQILGDSVFLGCTSLTTASVFSATPLSAGLFAGCNSLSYVMVSAPTPYVGDYAFYGCSNLKELSLPGTVTTVSSNAYQGCKNLSVWCYLDSTAGEFFSQNGFKVYEIGDANEDGKLNIKDATHIQKSTAGILTLGFSATLKADADFNSVVNVRDATHIQKKLAGLV